jgi:hypothetical protein
MFAFSRGPLIRLQCISPSFKFSAVRILSISRASPRTFSTSPLLQRAAKKTQVAPNSKAAAIPVKASSHPSLAAPAQYLSFASSLALKPHPTLLYTAPSHIGYTLSSYGASIFCFSYAAYNFNAHYYNPPPGLSSWVPIAFGVVCFMVTSVGGWLVLGPARLVKTITAIPAPQLALGRPGPLKVEVELRRMLPVPFLRPRRIIATPDEIMFNHRLTAPRMSAAEKRGAEMEEYRMKRINSEKSILTLPFRQLSVLFYNLFKSTMRAWSREGFLELGIRGKVYKLDVTGGWALDEGRALDRLIRART